MKKTFPLRETDKSDARVLAAILTTVHKYVKRERRKTVPAESNGWEFHCRVGPDAETALSLPLADIPAAIEAASASEQPAVYVEIISEPGKKPKNIPHLRVEKDAAL